MRLKDLALYNKLDFQLIEFSKEKHKLSGISTKVCRNVFVLQLIDSIRRVKYVILLRDLDISINKADPTSDKFDPLKAAVLFIRQGMVDEAFWLTFIAIHFGKARKSGWRLARDIYGCLGSSNCWTWARASSDPEKLKRWLTVNYKALTGDGVLRAFGNHRKYETLKPNSLRGPGKVFESYIKWIGPHKSHAVRFREAEEKVGSDPRAMFDELYKSMDEVVSFGRTAKFDYLTMLAKLGLIGIEPGSAYLQGSTGPVKGAQLLFGKINGRVALEDKLRSLEENLSLGEISMQVLEDALCNWQKSPKKYIHFKG